MRVIGLDPGLQRTGWGVIEWRSNRLRHIDHGVVTSDPSRDLAERLRQLHEALAGVLAAQEPDEAAIEVTLANRNPTASLKLGMARGVALLAPALLDLPVAEYQPTTIKQAVVGTGRATKEQVAMMVARLLPGCAVTSADAADALAVAICHAHTSASRRRWDPAAAGAQGGKVAAR